MIDRGVVDYIVKNVQAPLFLRGVVQKTNMLMIKIPYHRSGRKDGKSGFSLKKMFKLAKDAYIFAKNENVEKVIYKVEESNIMIR